MLDRLSDAAPIEAAGAAYMLHFFWRARGAVAEEHERLRALLARDDLVPQSRAELLVRLSDVDMHEGRVDASETAAREALALAEPGTEPRYLALAELAFSSIHRGETEEAVRLGRQAVEEAEMLDDASRIQAMGNLAGILARRQAHRRGAGAPRAVRSRGSPERAGGPGDRRSRRPRRVQARRARLRIRPCRIRGCADAAPQQRQTSTTRWSR